nr:DUF1345 domain-containing protein [Sphingomonas sp. PR090111-T3T-6A]
MKLDLGNRIAPVRFLIFLVLLAAGIPLLGSTIGWRHGTMLAFDLASAVFLLSLWRLLQTPHADAMRDYAARNDANRALLLTISVTVSLVVLVAVFSELLEKASPKPETVALIIATLSLAWLFSNMVYALHYAHVFYVQSDTDDDGTSEDSGGLDFPETKEPNYWDFIYFSFTLGMTFQTSDTALTNTQMRRITTLHCLAAFVFNLGVLAFTINVLGGGS